MPEPEPMTLPERCKYLRLLQPRYRSASRQERSQLLDEAQRVTGRHRKSLIRLLRGTLERKPRSRQRGRTYDAQVESGVRLIARVLDYPCAERLQPALVPIASSLAQHWELQLSPDLLEHLQGVSVSTVGPWSSVCAVMAINPASCVPARHHPTHWLARSPLAACRETCRIQATSRSTWSTIAAIPPSASTSIPSS